MRDHPTETDPQLVPLRHAARAIGVTEAWLRRECEAGHLPHLCAGRSILVDLDLIRRALLARARQIPGEQGRQHCERAQYQAREAYGVDPETGRADDPTEDAQ